MDLALDLVALSNAYGRIEGSLAIRTAADLVI